MDAPHSHAAAEGRHPTRFEPSLRAFRLGNYLPKNLSWVIPGRKKMPRECNAREIKPSEISPESDMKVIVHLPIAERRLNF